MLSGLLYLSAALAWVPFTEAPRAGRYLAPLALYAAGLLAKSVVVTLPTALLIQQWWQQGRVTATDLLRVAPFFVVRTATTAAGLAFNRSRGVGGYGYSLLERTLIAARAVWFYVGKIFWPVDVGLIYPHWEVRVGDPLAWAGLTAAGGLIATLWLLRHRIGRGPLVGVLFFGVTLSPTLGFVDFHFMLFSFVADRFRYLAGTRALAVVIGAATRGLAGSRGAGGQRPVALNVVLVATLLGVLGTLTWQHAANYRDGITFFRYIIAHNPQAREAHLNLGSALLRWNRLKEALAAYRIAEQQRPEDCKPPYGAGFALYHLGRTDEALRSLDRALALDPKRKDAQEARAQVLHDSPQERR